MEESFCIFVKYELYLRSLCNFTTLKDGWIQRILTKGVSTVDGRSLPSPPRGRAPGTRLTWGKSRGGLVIRRTSVIRCRRKASVLALAVIPCLLTRRTLPLFDPTMSTPFSYNEAHPGCDGSLFQLLCASKGKLQDVASGR